MLGTSRMGVVSCVSGINPPTSGSAQQPSTEASHQQIWCSFVGATVLDRLTENVLQKMGSFFFCVLTLQNVGAD